MAAMPPAPRDELVHPAPADPAAGWCERWTFAFVRADAHLGAWVRFTRFADHAWYEAALTGAHRQLLAVIDHDVPFRTSPFEVRTTGLWADHVCETPLDHWTLGLEAFALGVDDPNELLGRQMGDRVPLGFDLEWETDGPVLDDPPRPDGHGYAMACRVHGEVLVGASTLSIDDAVGHRTHRWGSIDGDGWLLVGTVEGGERWMVHHDRGSTIARVVAADGSVRAVPADGTALQRDAAGLPTTAGIGRALTVEVVAAVPIPQARSGPRRVHVSALCRLRAPDGRTGVGWLDGPIPPG